jgi:hypothetical protein
MGVSCWVRQRPGILRSKCHGRGSHFRAAQTFSVPVDENLWTDFGQSTGFREREREIADFGLFGGLSTRTSSTGFGVKIAIPCS